MAVIVILIFIQKGLHFALREVLSTKIQTLHKNQDNLRYVFIYKNMDTLCYVILYGIFILAEGGKGEGGNGLSKKLCTLRYIFGRKKQFTLRYVLNTKIYTLVDIFFNAKNNSLCVMFLYLKIYCIVMLPNYKGT